MAVTTLSDANFSEHLKSNSQVIVKYFATWCGSCKLIAPKFKRMSEEDKFENVSFVEVDAEANPEARKWAGVANLPFFAIVKNGELVLGEGVSKEDKILEMITSLSA